MEIWDVEDLTSLSYQVSDVIEYPDFQGAPFPGLLIRISGDQCTWSYGEAKYYVWSIRILMYKNTYCKIACIEINVYHDYLLYKKFQNWHNL